MSSNASLAIASALARDRGGLAIIYYPDFGLRDWLIGEVSSIAGDAVPLRRATTVEEAVAAPNEVVLLVPDDEEATVLDLEGSRDRFLEPPRSAPVVLFLLRGGPGQRTLQRSAQGTASWAHGSDPDPDRASEVDETVERQNFLAQAGTTPEQWLQETHGEERTASPAATAKTYWALLLTSR